MLDRFNEKILCPARIVRVFPDRDTCPRLVSALTVEACQDRPEANRYLNMGLLEEIRKEQSRNRGTTKRAQPVP